MLVMTARTRLPARFGDHFLKHLLGDAFHVRARSFGVLGCQGLGFRA